MIQNIVPGTETPNIRVDDVDPTELYIGAQARSDKSKIFIRVMEGSSSVKWVNATDHTLDAKFSKTDVKEIDLDKYDMFCSVDVIEFNEEITRRLKKLYNVE